MKRPQFMKAGRFTPTQAAGFGRAVGSVGSVGYVAIGPVAILFDLPARFQKPDPAPSIFDLNEHFRQLAEAAQRPRPTE